jgi:hypothetical protein
VGLEGGSLAPVHKIYYIIYIFMHIDNLCNNYGNGIKVEAKKIAWVGLWRTYEMLTST